MPRTMCSCGLKMWQDGGWRVHSAKDGTRRRGLGRVDLRTGQGLPITWRASPAPNSRGAESLLVDRMIRDRAETACQCVVIDAYIVQAKQCIRIEAIVDQEARGAISGALC